jgi:hypothetical protein
MIIIIEIIITNHMMILMAGITTGMIIIKIIPEIITGDNYVTIKCFPEFEIGDLALTFI